MKDDSCANSKEDINEKSVISQKRQKILDEAFVEMRKAQSKMNPKFLKKIRDLVRNSPILVEKLGLKKSEVPSEPAKDLKVKAESVVTAQPVSREPFKNAPKKGEDFEQIDQAKNMDVLSKLLEINPDKKDMIKKLLSEKKN